MTTKIEPEVDYRSMTGAQLLARKARAEKSKAAAEQTLKRIAQESRKIDAHRKITFAAWIIGTAKKIKTAGGKIDSILAMIEAMDKANPMSKDLATWYAEQKTAILAAKTKG